MAKITFKPKQTIKILLSPLSSRSRDIISRRYGLNKDGQKMTLEAVGNRYGITRERVRQIENNSLYHIKKSDEFKNTSPVFDELKGLVDSFGFVVPEEEILNYVSKTPSVQSHVQFVLHLGNHFIFRKEGAEFKQSWSTSSEVDKHVRDVIRKLYKILEDNRLMQEEELIEQFISKLRLQNKKSVDYPTALRWLSLSKKIDKNPLGEWGLCDSPNVRTKSIRDYAYLIIRSNGSPMHFSEVANAIEKTFNRPAHAATCHNELIKDPRFVLVGRGLYALVEWGYNRGVVRDVIREILRNNGPHSRDEILKKVRKERYVKDNTILVNLHNSKYFRRTPEGLYGVAENVSKKSKKVNKDGKTVKKGKRMDS